MAPSRRPTDPTSLILRVGQRLASQPEADVAPQQASISFEQASLVPNHVSSERAGIDPDYDHDDSASQKNAHCDYTTTKRDERIDASRDVALVAADEDRDDPSLSTNGRTQGRGSFAEVSSPEDVASAGMYQDTPATERFTMSEQSVCASCLEKTGPPVFDSSMTSQQLVRYLNQLNALMEWHISRYDTRQEQSQILREELAEVRVSMAELELRFERAKRLCQVPLRVYGIFEATANGTTSQQRGAQSQDTE